jgi:hypothetical protein
MHFNLYKSFDYLGVIAFSFLVGDALLDLQDGIGHWRVWVRLFVSSAGFLVDGYLIFFYKK